MIVDVELERLRFLATDTDLPSFNKSTVGRSEEEITAVVDKVVPLVYAAVCSNDRAPSNMALLPPILLDELGLIYFKTMAPVGGVVEMEKYASPEGSENQTAYRKALDKFNRACTKVFLDYAEEVVPEDAEEEVTTVARKKLLNRHRWMTHGPTCSRLWAGSDMYPYMLKGPLLHLNNILVTVAPAVSWVRCESAPENNVTDLNLYYFPVDKHDRSVQPVQQGWCSRRACLPWHIGRAGRLLRSQV